MDKSSSLTLASSRSWVRKSFVQQKWELKKPSHLGYMTQSAADYNNDPMAVRQAVYDQHIWAALVVNANATARLRRAVETGDRSYDPTGAAQFIYNEARDETTYGNYIAPMVTQLQTQIRSQFGEK
jgi:hypothetical protein